VFDQRHVYSVFANADFKNLNADVLLESFKEADG
jgi:hypothetical protein